MGFERRSEMLKREDILEFVQLKDSDEEKNDTIVESEEKNEESKNVNLEQPYSIIAFGYPDEDEKLFRTNKDVDRKRISHVCRKLDKNLEKIPISQKLKRYFWNNIR